MNELSKRIQDIIEERQKVLFELERVLFTKRYNLSKKHLEILAVQSIPIVYSIWEGFIQTVFGLYIDELNKLNINFNQFSDEIIIHHMESTFKQLIEYPQQPSKKINYFNKLERFYNNEKVELSRLINTESNVGFEVLNKLLKNFSLEVFPKHWGQYTHPSPNLEETLLTFLRYRNSVAHGGDITSEESVTQEVFVKYKNLVINLMYSIHDRMIAGLENETYKRT